jgi:PLP dependent protein
MLPGENYQAIAEDVAREVIASGRDKADVKLIAVSKTVDVDAVVRAMDQGARDFGENRPDCLIEKAAALPEATWHFIGNIQSRRIPDIVAHASLIHSLYQLGHAQKIDTAAKSLGKVQDVLVEVNVSGEDSKGGVTPDEAPELVAKIAALDNVRVIGLMTMAPQGDLEVARETFAGLRCLRDSIKETLSPEHVAEFNELSMGMSEDWRVAVREGATMVRIGRAVFSESFVL